MNGPTANVTVAASLVPTLSDWADVWWRWMLVGSWQGLASAAIVGAILWIGRRRISAPLRHGLLFLLLIKLAMPPLPGFPIGVFTWLPSTTLESASYPAAAPSLSADDAFTLPAASEPALREQVLTTIDPAPTAAIPSPYSHDVTRPAPPRATGPNQTELPDVNHPGGDKLREEPLAAKRTSVATSAEAHTASTFVPNLPAEHAAKPAARTIPRSALPSLSWPVTLMIAHWFGAAAIVLAVVIHHARLIRSAMRARRGLTHTEWEAVANRVGSRLGCKRPPRLVVSSAVDTPCITGWRRPTIYIPQWADELNETERTALIAHELAHVWRWDHWLAPVQCVLVSWLWWNPLAWFVGRRIRLERERCCDDLVLAHGCCDRRRYADLIVNTLARVNVLRWLPAGALGMAEATDPIADRLVRIMEPDTRPIRMRRSELAAAAVLAATLLPSVPHAATTAPNPKPIVSQSGLAVSGPTPSQVESPQVAPKELRVIVRDDSGNPVAGAQASLKHAGKTFTFDGDDQGIVKIDLPAPVAEWQFPHVNITWPGFTRAHTVPLKPGEPLPETLEVKLPRMRTVHGRLVNHENQPVMKARICSGFSGGNVLPPMRDWPNGEFAAEVAATDVRFLPSPQSPNVLAVEAPDLAIAVAEVATDAGPITIRLGPGKPVGGRVVDARGKPIAGVRLISDFVGPTNPPTLKIETTTNDSGVFWFEHFPTDVPMKFSVMHSHYANLRQQEFAAGKVDHQLTLQPVLVVAGRVVDAVTEEPLGRILVQQGSVFSGHVTWRFKRPVAFSDGQFEMKFPEVPDNTVLRIVADGYQPLVLQPPINQYGKPNQTFELKRAHAISLRVLTGDGQPAKGLVAEVRGQADADMLQLVPAVHDRRMTMSDAARPLGAEVDDAGRARITNAPDGKQVLTVYDSSATVVYQEEIEIGPALATKEHVVRIAAPPVAPAPARSAPDSARAKAPAGAAKTAASSATANVGNVLVRALRDGKPLAQAQVGLIPKPGFQAKFQGRTGDDGTHLFGGLAPGEYEVQVFDGFISVGGQQLTKLRRSVFVEVEPGKTIEVLGLGGAGASLDGTLRDKEGKPLPAIFTYITYLGTGPPVGVRGGATAVPFSVQSDEPDEPAAKSAALATMTLHTDAAGKFVVPALAPGFYQVMFRRGGPNPDFQFHTLFPVRPDPPRQTAEFRPLTEPSIKTGDRIPRISGTTPDGHDVQVDSLAGKVLLIEFWASWNKPSLVGLTATRKLREQFTRDDFTIIGINLDQEIDDLKSTLKNFSIDWQQVHIPANRTGWVLHEFGIQSLPERILVGKDGRLVAAGLDADELVPAIEAALAK